MIDANVIRFAVEYLDKCSAENTPATLVGMHWFIDGRNKTLPLLAEVNEALQQRPSARVERVDGSVVFGPFGTDRAVSCEDMKLADNRYRKDLSAALKKLK